MTAPEHLETVVIGAGQAGADAGVRGGRPPLDDGTVLDVANVVWCTGFRLDFGWIDLPVCDEDGSPREERGVVTEAERRVAVAA
jgi:hypothetical protein